MGSHKRRNDQLGNWGEVEFVIGNIVACGGCRSGAALGFLPIRISLFNNILVKRQVKIAKSPMSDLNAVFESTARYFSVLGEPTRLKILHAICTEERCVTDIIRATGALQANVSRHLGLMYQAGLLSRRREGTQIFYRVAEPLFLELCRSISVQVASRLPATEGQVQTAFGLRA
jgi:DNA-binding transcriptional ArsR family regulator